MLFGGGQAPSMQIWTVRLPCPRRNEQRESLLHVPLEAGERLIRVEATVSPASGDASGANPGRPRDAGAPSGTTGPNWLQEEMKDVRMGSVATLRTFATTMLTTSTGGTAVYFAVLEHLDPTGIPAAWRWVTLIAPILLVLAAGTYGSALMPVLALPDEASYADERRRYLVRTYGRLRAASMLLLGATAASVATWGALLWT